MRNIIAQVSLFSWRSDHEVSGISVRDYEIVKFLACRNEDAYNIEPRFPVSNPRFHPSRQSTGSRRSQRLHRRKITGMYTGAMAKFFEIVAHQKDEIWFWGSGSEQHGPVGESDKSGIRSEISRLQGLVTRISPIRYREFLRGIHTRLNPTGQLGGCMISIPGGEDTST